MTGRQAPQGIASTDSDLAAAVTDWLRIQCGMINGVSCGLVFHADIGTETARLLGCWPQGAPGIPIRQEAVITTAKNGKGRFEPVPNDSSLFRFYYPFPFGSLEGSFFVVVLEMESRSDLEQRTIINLLRWGSEWLNFTLRKNAPAHPRDLALVFQLAAACLDQEDSQGTAMTLVTEITAHFDCQRASLGLRKRKHTEVFVLSHSSRFEHRANLMRTIGAAMDESIDQDRVIIYSESASPGAVITRAHSELAQEMDDAVICTLPLTYKNDAIGALVLERNTGTDFDDAMVRQLEQLLAVIAPVLVLERRDEQALPIKLWRTLRETSSRLLGPSHLRLKLASVVGLALLLFFSVAQGRWQITADASVEGSVQRAIAAPIDGYIESASLRAGDLVTENQELGALDDRDLKLERLKWSTRRQQMVREHRDAMAQHNRSEVNIVSARIEQADAELQLLDEQLSRTRILAPFDGVIIEGDLSQLLGTPVARGDVLFKVAPLEDYRIVLKVDEKDIAPVKPTQTGQLLLTSMPNRTLEFKVSKITAISNAGEGRNIFRVEADLLQSDVPLRPGMEGIGKIDVGEENLFWIWTRDLLNWLRLQVWALWR